MTLNRVNRRHWPTKENRQHFRMFCICSVHGQIGLKWLQMRPGCFFTTDPDVDILGDTDVYLELHFVRFPFFDLYFQIPGLSDSWILEPGSWLWLAAARGGGHESPDLGDFWTALPDHRIQEIQGTMQNRQNPISASPVWGKMSQRDPNQF